ncbi:tRNA-His guanylyltransferase [Brettanomyces nanus]|uniref:tRNA(His) guanylyltransferase n=1 Tax=Eeniella nana TaxID=13502 RepID=A0A875RWH1_EENNA|nr:tRNA-His guanylyltransferase [Brettanomyces nanus]QPG73216.1 tRNA-His guanylyltransferase [Brettanomyces nanus]
MAKSRFEYVRNFERENLLLPETHIIIRVDGRGFHKFSEKYEFDKPNDDRALKVMNLSACQLMNQIPDIMMAYGDSDEYSFLLRKQCDMFERREFKLITTFGSTFSANYQYFWSSVCSDKPLTVERLPTFDARAVVYPSDDTIKDYFRWRQVDCHINNLYNTTFWNLVIKGGMTPHDAENKLIGTVSADKNEILFKQFGINYNDEPEIYKKGTLYIRDSVITPTEANTRDLTKRQLERLQKRLKKSEIKELHCDIIKDEFWDDRPWLLC